VIGAMLTQEDGSKEYIIAYLRRRLLDTEIRYTFIKKTCLSLYYVCTKLRHYLLTSSCTIIYAPKTNSKWQVGKVGIYIGGV
jgi:hypothetical protein